MVIGPHSNPEDTNRVLAGLLPPQPARCGAGKEMLRTLWKGLAGTAHRNAQGGGDNGAWAMGGQCQLKRQGWEVA